MPSWLKAGLIAGAYLIVVALIGFIPVLGCLSLPLTWIGYILAGVLAVLFLPPVRTAGQGAGQGALAAAVAQVMGGLVNIIVGIVQASSVNGEQVLSQIPPESMEQLRSIGIDPSIIVGPAGTGSILLVCCGIGVFVAAALGAVAGAITAAVKPS